MDFEQKVKGKSGKMGACLFSEDCTRNEKNDILLLNF